MCCMDANDLTVCMKTDDVETRFYTSNYELDRLLSKGKNKKSNQINERQLRWKNHDEMF